MNFTYIIGLHWPPAIPVLDLPHENTKFQLWSIRETRGPASAPSRTRRAPNDQAQKRRQNDAFFEDFGWADAWADSWAGRPVVSPRFSPCSFAFLVPGPIGGPMAFLCCSRPTSSSPPGPIYGWRKSLCVPDMLCSIRATRGPARSVGRCSPLKPAYNTKGLSVGPVSESALGPIRLLCLRRPP